MRKVNQLSAKILVGFDGFIDTIYHVVASRKSPTDCRFMTRISQFSTRLLEAHSKSTNVELVESQVRLGGNGPILANSLLALGFDVMVVGALDDEIFAPLKKRCLKYISLGSPGKTDALEFVDGKILMGKHDAILKLDLEQINLAPLLEKAAIFASTNWTMVYGMTALWHRLETKIFPALKKCPEWMFVDLADPAKRSDSDLKKALLQLARLQSFTKVVLGLNEKEAERVASVLKTTNICQKLGIEQVVIHANSWAKCSSNTESVSIKCPLIKKPKITTGGGDNFNAGYIAGLAQNLSLKETLKLAADTAAYYIRHGHHASRNF